MKRAKHSLSHYKLVTCDMGQLIPVGLIETLPGDTIQQSTSLLLRMSPMLAPVMHPVSVRLHHWFVPNRLVYSGWEDFITGGPNGTGSAVPYPTNSGTLTVNKGEILDYMGVPISTAFPAGSVSLLPVRAYNKIYNEWYRDEDLVTARTEDTVTAAKIAWEKDYFTTSRPWSQKGPAVTLPIGSSAPVKTQSTEHTTTGTNVAMKLRRTDTNAQSTALLGANAGQLETNSAAVAAWGIPQYPSNLIADLTNATPADIIDIRRAFALQRYQEARAQYGSRYTEYLRYLGVRSSDARLQRPEYLGGGKQTVAFSEVLRTGSAADETSKPVGEMKGHGIAALRSNRYRYFCEEHGYIMTMLSIRPRTMYVNGIPRTFRRRTKEDYFQKELELIGQQEIQNAEIFAGTNATTNDATFGYQDRYAEYRHEYSNISGDFRNTLNFWHLARVFGSLPTLNNSFIECDPAKRIFAEQTQHSCWVMVSHSIQARRMVGNRTIGRVI